MSVLSACATLRIVAVTRAIRIGTELPGPRSRELLARELEAVAHPLVVHLPVFAAAAEGAIITDVDGNRFIDFAGGVGVMNVGHSHPRVVEALQEQSAHFTHTDFTVVPYEGYVELAERLGALAPSQTRSGRRSSTPARKPSRTRSSSPASPRDARR